MKKILSFIAFAVAVISFTACSNVDNDWYQPSSTRVLDVKSADVTFGPEATQGNIVVDTKEALDANSNEDWCTVSVDGNIVKVNVTSNEKLESRNATIEIKSATRSVKVPVHQDGMILVVEADSKYLFNASKNKSVLFKNKSNCTVNVTSDVEWIHIVETTAGFEVSVDDNASEDYRRGVITIESSTSKQEVYVGQYGTVAISKLPIEGTYTAFWDEFNEEDALETYYQEGVTITAGTEENTYVISNLAVYGQDYPLLLHYNPSNGEYYIASGYSPGRFSSYTLRCMMATGNADNFSSATEISTAENMATSEYRIAFGWYVNDEAELVFGYVPNKTTKNETPGFMINAYSGTRSAGYLFMFWNLILCK